MSTANTTKANYQNQNFATSQSFGQTVPYDQISSSGAYVCQWSGHLLRVPEDGVTAGRSPMVNIVGSEPLFVTKLSDNPWITITKARLLAANYDLNVNF